jgi:hypothetical protein
MTQRCGSYPLMNLAEDYAVDYGDVQLIFEAMCVWVDPDADPASVPEGRGLTWSAAAERTEAAIGRAACENLANAMEPLAVARVTR